MEIRGALPALLLVHFHSPQEDATEARADNSNGGEGIVQDVGREEGGGLVRRQHQFAVWRYVSEII